MYITIYNYLTIYREKWSKKDPFFIYSELWFDKKMLAELIYNWYHIGINYFNHFSTIKNWFWQDITEDKKLQITFQLYWPFQLIWLNWTVVKTELSLLRSRDLSFYTKSERALIEWFWGTCYTGNDVEMVYQRYLTKR